MSRLLAIAEAVRRANLAVMRAVAWLSLAMVVLTFAVVVMRYGLRTGSIALQEFVLYLHATLFLCAIAGTMASDGHVRVDVLRTRMSPRAQALVDAAGSLLLALPLAVFIFWVSFDYVAEAWARRETSPEPGGLPYVWLLKTLLLVFPVQLGAQALADFLIHLQRARRG